MKTKPPISPPKLAQRFLLSFLREELKEEVLGDLEEKFYTKLEESSAFRAMFNHGFNKRKATYKYMNKMLC